MALSDNLAAYWKLDEASGNAADATGNGNTAVNTNSVTYATGKINNGADFESSSSQKLVAADSASLSATGNQSWSFWYKPESNPAERGIIDKYGSSGNRSYILSHWAPGELRARIDNSADAETEVAWTGLTINNGTWYHIVFVYTAAAHTMDLYINGVAQTQKDIVRTDIKNTTASVVLGGEALVAVAPLDGMLDEVGIWARALTAGEVTTLYNGGAGLSYPYTNNYTTTLSETVTLTDSVLRATGRSLSETITHTDTLLRSVARSLTETITHTDTILKRAGRAFSETLTLSDVIERLKGQYRTLTETVTHSDTFNSILSHFITFTETITHTDTLSKGVGRMFTETLTVLDFLSFQIARIFSEAITLADTMLKQAARSFSDTVTLTDDFIVGHIKQLLETITLSDSLNRQIAQTRTEIIEFTDSLFRQLGRAFSEIATFTDELQMAIGRSLAETMTLTDVLVHQVARTLSESIAISDTLSTLRSRFRTLTETISFTDTLFSHLLTKVKKGIAILTTRTENIVLQSKDDKTIL